MEDSKTITHATFSAVLHLTPTGLVLTQLEDPSTQVFSSSPCTHIPGPVTELVFSALWIDLTSRMEPSYQHNLFRQLLVKTTILSHSSKLALDRSSAFMDIWNGDVVPIIIRDSRATNTFPPMLVDSNDVLYFHGGATPNWLIFLALVGLL